MSRLLKILLLGKNGFTGRNIHQTLIADGEHEITAPAHIELDAADEKQVFSELVSNSYDVVINCLDVRAFADAVYAEKRLRMYFNLALHSDLYGKMIYFGTGAEFGCDTPVVKVTENDFGRQIPSDSYGFAMFQMATHAIQSANIYNFRLFGIFGPYELWQRRFISNCICKLLFGYPLTIRQNRVMDYLCVDDLVRVVKWSLTATLGFHDYNLSSGNSYELSQLAEMAQERCGVSVPLFIARPGYAVEYTADNSRISTEMSGFEAEPIMRSIDKLRQYYQANLKDISKEHLLYNEW